METVPHGHVEGVCPAALIDPPHARPPISAFRLQRLGLGLSERKLICWLRRAAESGLTRKCYRSIGASLVPAPADAPVFVGGQGNVRFDFGSRFRNHEAIFLSQMVETDCSGHPCGFKRKKQKVDWTSPASAISEGFRPFSGPGTRRMPAGKPKVAAPEPTALQHRYSSSLQFIPFRFSFCMRERDL